MQAFLEQQTTGATLEPRFQKGGNFMTISGQALLDHLVVYTSSSRSSRFVESDTNTLDLEGLIWRKLNFSDDELINISNFERITCRARADIQITDPRTGRLICRDIPAVILWRQTFSLPDQNQQQHQQYQQDQQHQRDLVGHFLIACTSDQSQEVYEELKACLQRF